MRHWGPAAPLQSKLSKSTSVPYRNALRWGAPYKGEEIVRDLETVLTHVRPTKIFVSHPGDHHPDHRSLALFLTVALWQTEQSPAVFYYLVHHKGWPRPLGYHPELGLLPPDGLNPGQWLYYGLSDDVMTNNLRALQAHRTQYEYSHWYLTALLRHNELFAEMLPIPMPNGQALVVASSSPASAREIPDYVSSEEEPAFAGIMEVQPARRAGQLVASIALNRPMTGGARLELSAFGWRHDRPFTQMPKIRVLLDHRSHSVFNQDEQLPPGTAAVDEEGRHVIIALREQILADPQRLFFDVRSTINGNTGDQMAWKILDLQ